MLEIIDANALNLAKAILVLFIMVDPLGNIPIFMSLTEKMPKKQKTKTFNTATIVGIILLLIFAFAGQEIFSIFGVSIFSFQIAGGILLLIIAIRLIITGRIIELQENKKLVQEWYFGDQNEKSLVTIYLSRDYGSTQVTVEHTNIPDDDFKNISEGWNEYYFGAIQLFFNPNF